jgi:uncharacterized protein YcaQ
MKEAKRVIPNTPEFAPASSDEERTLQMGSLAMDLAEMRMRSGIASSAEILYFIKAASPEARLERTKLAEETKLIQARVADMERSKNTEELYSQAIAAFQEYRGIDYEEDGDENEYGPYQDIF